MESFCLFPQYSGILGKPGKGVHSIRIFNLAIVDIILTFIGAYFISRFLKKDYWITLLLFFISGIILHRIFCVRTTIDKLLF